MKGSKPDLMISERYQKICVHEKLSEPLCIHSVIPRGSILAPALFLSLQKYLASVFKNYSQVAFILSTPPTIHLDPIAKAEEKRKEDLEEALSRQEKIE